MKFVLIISFLLMVCIFRRVRLFIKIEFMYFMSQQKIVLLKGYWLFLYFPFRTFIILTFTFNYIFIKNLFLCVTCNSNIYYSYTCFQFLKFYFWYYIWRLVQHQITASLFLNSFLLTGPVLPLGAPRSTDFVTVSIKSWLSPHFLLF